MNFTSSSDIFHITVGTAPSYKGAISIQNELNLLKAAVLYADRVTFCSVTTSFLVLGLQLDRLTREQWLDVIANSPYGAQYQAAIDTYKVIKQKKRHNKQELIMLLKMKALFSGLEKRVRDYFNDLAIKAGVGELERAISSGVVDLKYIDISASDNGLDQYFKLISEAVLSGDTYPLFDDLTRSAVHHGIKEGKIQTSKVSSTRAKQVGLSAELLQRLPLFDKATTDEVMDIRSELSKPLVRFRSAIIQFSRQIESAAWDDEFMLESEQVFREHVEPAILEIEEICKLNKPLLSLATHFVNKPLSVATSSALGILLAQATQMPEILVAGLGLTAGAAAIGLETAIEYRDKQQKAESNQLYFYYKAAKLLDS
jgi:hypothetical protein